MAAVLNRFLVVGIAVLLSLHVFITVVPQVQADVVQLPQDQCTSIQPLIDFQTSSYSVFSFVGGLERFGEGICFLTVHLRLIGVWLWGQCLLCKTFWQHGTPAREM
jgi:hypothetical protein